MTATLVLETRPGREESVCVVLDRAAVAVAAQRAAAVDLLVAAAEWALAHPAASLAQAAGWGEADLHGEGLVPLAGPGAPLVAEFAPLELAARLGWTPEAAKALVAEALELCCRLPRLWALTLEGTVTASVARGIAACTRDLSAEAVNQADRLVCADPAQVSRVSGPRLVEEIRLWFDPDRAIEDERAALARRGVWLHPGTNPATTEVAMLLDTPDALALDHTVAGIAGTLRALGDTDPLDLRRAKAVGVLADPQRALHLAHDATSDPTLGPAGAETVAGVGRAAPPVTLFLHFSDAALLTGTGPVLAERLGAASQDLIRDWLAGAQVTVQPVLDVGRADAVDAHDPPAWMRELVRLRDAHCVFPGCRRDSRLCDLDHIDPFQPADQGGPPGQTRPDNLAPLCRTHHRAKTHADYAYIREPDGSYRWTTPNGVALHVIPASRRPHTP